MDPRTSVADSVVGPQPRNMGQLIKVLPDLYRNGGKFGRGEAALNPGTRVTP
jgi:hypothetical protein